MAVENGLCSIDLFDGSIVKLIDFSNSPLMLNHGLSPFNAGDGLVMRPLNSNDYAKGYLDLLKQLTEVGEISQDKFLGRFMEMKNCGSYYIVVIEDAGKGKVVASGTLAVEYKFIHRNASRGRVEDIVVDKDYRKRQLGKLLVETLTLLSKELGCYKTSLECKKALIPFYSQFGFKREESEYLCRRFFH